MRKKTNFTPGPWVAKRNSHYWEIRPKHGAGEEAPWSIGNVCSSYPENPDGGLQESNARLIAAAPDLLEALECLLSDVKAFNDLDEEDGARLYAGTVMMAEQAIAKAKGADHDA